MIIHLVAPLLVGGIGPGKLTFLVLLFATTGTALCLSTCVFAHRLLGRVLAHRLHDRVLGPLDGSL